MTKLNLGCGRDIRKGYVNLDRVALPGVNKVHDFEKDGIPYPDNHFDEVFCKHVLEHLHSFENYIRAMEEIHRVLVPNGIAVISVPHYSGPWGQDPTHHIVFNYHSFRFFGNEEKQFDYYTNARLKIEYISMKYSALENRFWWKPINWLMNKLANRKPVFYEGILAGMFPLCEINVVLRKVKE